MDLKIKIAPGEFEAVIQEAIRKRMVEVINSYTTTDQLKAVVTEHWQRSVEEAVNRAVTGSEWLQEKVNNELDFVVRERLAAAIEKLVPALRREIKK